MSLGTRRTVAVLVCAAIGLGTLLVGIQHRSRKRSAPMTGPRREQQPDSAATIPAPPGTATADRPAIAFREIGRAAGVDWTHHSGFTPEKMFPTANGSGAALLDFNADGLLDLYCLSLCELPIDRDSKQRTPNCLFRGTPGGSFESVSAPSGTDLAEFSQGATAGDLDNDGFSELYLTVYGGNRLLHNMGDGTFGDRSAISGAVGVRWGSSAACLDYDEDGSIDLYVANYGKWRPEANLFCGDKQKGIRIFCRPTFVTPEVHSLYRNRGDGSFEEVAGSLGIARSDGRGQGVVAADVNGDRHIDLYVANDMSPNFLFLNQGAGRWLDATEKSGAAFDGSGTALAGMGVDAADINHDGRPELFVTNFYNEYNNLYLNLGDGFFEDISGSSGLGPDSLLAVGWGTLLADLDNDTHPDALVANGHVDDNTHEIGTAQPFRQRPQVWRNTGRLRFERVSDSAGEFFGTEHVSRGAAFGDLDNDGRLDVVIAQIGESPSVLQNDGGHGNGWIRLQLAGRSSNRDSVGASIVVRAGRHTIHRQIKGGGSYLSAHDLRCLVGVADAPRVDSVTVVWPSGRELTLGPLELHQTHRIAEPATTQPSD